jgi:hypothetical protein
MSSIRQTNTHRLKISSFQGYGEMGALSLFWWECRITLERNLAIIRG